MFAQLNSRPPKDQILSTPSIQEHALILSLIKLGVIGEGLDGWLSLEQP